MYDKAGSVLRLEMVINDPEGFTVRKEVTRKGKKVFKWVDMLKGVAYLFRYKDVSLAANGRYLNALAQVERSWTYCKDSALSPLARYKTRMHRHVRSSTTTRRSVSHFPFEGRRLIPRFLCETQRRHG